MKDLALKKIYCNGCSHSAGGGLEINRSLYNEVMVRDYYKKRYDVWWDNQYDITYSSVLAQKLNVDLQNDSISGGGTERVIRMAYDFVKQNWGIKNQIFLVLELPSLGRLDFFSKKLNEYVVVNFFYNNNDYSDDSVSQIYGTRGYYRSEYNDDFKILNKALENYYLNFFSKKTLYLKISKEINTFLTYLKFHKIKFIFFGGEFSKSIDSNLKKNNLLNLRYENLILQDFHEFAIETKSTIAEECEFLTTDIHPGYFCHKKFGNLIGDYIIENYDNF